MGNNTPITITVELENGRSLTRTYTMINGSMPLTLYSEDLEEMVETLLDDEVKF